MNSLAQLQQFSDVPGADEGGVATLKGLEVIFNNVVTIILGFAGIALFVLLIVGGFNFITAADDPKKVESARKTLTTAVIGLVVVVIAFLIIRLIASFTGAQDILQFKIYQ